MGRRGGLLWTALLVFAGACDEKLDPIIVLDDCDTDVAASWSDDVEPLLETRCLSCHSADREGAERHLAPAGVNFDSYEEALDWSDRIGFRVESGTMPPGGGLSYEERCVIERWLAAGAPR